MFLIHLTLYAFNMQVVICRSVIILNNNLMLPLFLHVAMDDSGR